MASRDSPIRALLTVLVTAVVCSSIVSGSVVLLRPIQINHKMLERSGNILQLTGLLPPGGTVADQELLELFKSLDARVVDLDAASLDTAFDPYTFDDRKAAADPELSVAIPAGQDLAGLGRRGRYMTVYLIWRADELTRIVLPIRGAGMWSMLHGYLSLESDLNTIAGVVFHEQAETPGLGDQIAKPHWQQKWIGKMLYDETGEMLFRVAEGPVAEGSAGADYQVDALTGATVTANAVTALLQYWFGPNGYGPLLQRLREQPPRPPATPTAQQV